MPMCSRIIGDASEFYRTRVVRVDDADAPDLQWRDDILYRQPPVQAVEEFAVYRVELVDLATDDVAASLGEYPTEEAARQVEAEVVEALESMTKSAFDARFLEPV